MEMLWSARQLADIDRAVGTARRGGPALLVVQGQPGAGKSAFLREVRRRASGFAVLRTEGERSHPLSPARLLRELGAPAGETVPADPFVAAQRLRERIDSIQLTSPVLLAVDDFQWVGAEAAELVGHVLRRSAGDRLLVAVAHREIRPPELAQWRHLTRDLDGRLEVVLAGLAEEDATALIRQVAAAAGAAADADIDIDIDQALIARLVRHTEGNPLYLRSILAEYDVDDLRRRRQLPAPGDVVRALTDRVAAFPEPARELLRAIVILGPGWTPLHAAATLAQVAGAGQHLQLLRRDGLVVVRGAEADTDARIVHQVYAAAVVEAMPADARRTLFRRAADLQDDPDRRLQYRFWAADGPDERLAGDLAAHARALHDAGDHRRAAEHLRWARTVTADPSTREFLHSERLFELIMSRDVDAVEGVESITDPVRRGMVAGARLVIQRRWADARPALEGAFAGLDDPASSPIDARTRARVCVLLAWTLVMTGDDIDRVARALDGIDRVDGLDPAAVRDPALSAFERVSAGQLRLRRAPTGQLTGLLGVAAATAVPVQDTHLLSWRGSVFALSGRFAEGGRDLREYVRRVDDGWPDATDGATHAVLAFGQWMSGQWTRAGASLGIAVASRFTRSHPIVAAVRPFPAIGAGSFDEARELLEVARDVVVQAPWPPALQVICQADVLLHRADGSEAGRAGLLDGWRRWFGAAVDDVAGAVSPIWLAHLAIARIWAGELRSARALADRLTMAASSYPWAPGAGVWINGLAAEHERDHESARRHLDRAIALGLDQIPLHRAHVAADLARVAAAQGDDRAARMHWRDAAGRYATLGAVGQLPEPPIALPGGTGVAGGAGHPALAQLTEREREVVALTAEGLSYTQIAKELYVTRSTVAFHMGRVFAKTNTTGRHELVALMRAG